jgi:ferritin-like metal-binding protein YciE
MLHRSFKREHYSESQGEANSLEEVIKPYVDSLYQKTVLITHPIVDATNKIIDVFNEVPKKIWTNGVSSSISIRSKLKQYAEGMTSYNRTPDDSENLKMVTINRRHKVFIDDLREKNTRLYEYFVNISKDFYKTKFEEQDGELIRHLMDLTKVYPQLDSLITKKIKKMDSGV